MKQDLLWDAAMKAIYPTGAILTQSERKKIGKLLNELREINASPEDLLARAKQYPKVMPKDCILTLAGLVHNWSRCKPPGRIIRPTYQAPPIGPRTQEGYRAAIDCMPGYIQRKLKLKHGE